MRRKVISITLAILLSFTINIGNFSYARDYVGKIDFFKVFSKNDENTNRIGNKIYNWSIYMPSDAVVNKNPKATNFNMYTSSFKTNISVNVLKNIHSLSLEEAFAIMLQSSAPSYGYSEFDNSYRCSAKIEENKDKNKYIVISSIYPESYLYKASDDEEEAGSYIEYRIYLGKSNNVSYIYEVNLSMDLQYYRQHPNLFSKISDSFKTSFDANNPNIKDLSDQVTTYRTFENKIYGWKIELAPYWKLQGSETSINQLFKPLYSDQEIGTESGNSDNLSSQDTPSTSENDKTANPTQTEPSAPNQPDSAQPSTDKSSESKPDDTNASKIKDSLSVSVISSVYSEQSFDKWADNEINSMQSNYNKKLYTQLIAPQNMIIPNSKGKFVVSNIKSSSSDSIVEGILLAQGNGYRYKVILTMTESKYNEKTGKDIFDRILNSFAITKTKSKFIGELLPADSIFDFNASKVISLKKYNLKIAANNNWSEAYSIYDGQTDDYSSYYYSYPSPYDSNYDSDASTNESLTINHPISGATLAISADIATAPFNDMIDDLLNGEVNKQDCRSKDLNVKAFKSKVGDITIYKVVENYNLAKITELLGKDSKKVYNYSNLNDCYIYVFETNGEIYNINLSMPLIHTSTQNMKNIEDLWKEVVVNQVKIGEQATNWESVDLSKYADKSDTN